MVEEVKLVDVVDEGVDDKIELKKVGLVYLLVLY